VKIISHPNYAKILLSGNVLL